MRATFRPLAQWPLPPAQAAAGWIFVGAIALAVALVLVVGIVIGRVTA